MNPDVLVAAEELRHVRSGGGHTWEAADSRAGKDESQNALVLVEGQRLKSLFDRGADHERSDLSAAVVEVGRIAFVEGNDQQAAVLERRTGDQRRDIGLQPCVSLGKTAGVGVVHYVRRDERILRQRVIGEVGRELCKGSYILRLECIIVTVG